jgi:hypothetical protein
MPLRQRRPAAFSQPRRKSMVARFVGREEYRDAMSAELSACGVALATTHADKPAPEVSIRVALRWVRP